MSKSTSGNQEDGPKLNNMKFSFINSSRTFSLPEGEKNLKRISNKKPTNTSLFNFKKMQKDTKQYNLPFESAKLKEKKMKKLQSKSFVDIIQKSREEVRDAMKVEENTAQAHESDLLENENDLASIKNGEDAIGYFAWHGDQSSIKFIYLNRAPSVSKYARYNPYGLVAVKESDIEPEHFIMSSTGITHVHPQEQFSDLINLQQWTRETTLFNVVSQIGFFKNYLLTKAIRNWKSMVRFKLYSQQKRNFERSFFHTQATFLSPLLLIQSELTSCSTIKLVNSKSETQKLYTKNSWSLHQEKAREVALRNVESIVEKCYGHAKKLCNHVVKTRKKFQNLSHTDFDEEEKKHCSMMQLKQMAKDRKRRQRQADREYSLLEHFIRLIDYMIVQTLTSLSINSLNHFREDLIQARSQTGIFEVAVIFDNEGQPCCDPSWEGMQEIITNLLSTNLKFVDSIPRIMYSVPFKDFMRKSLAYPRTGSVISTSPAFMKAVDQIKGILRADFDSTYSHINSNVMLELAPLHETCKEWNLEEYKGKDHSIESLRSDFQRVSKFGTMMENLPNCWISGTIYLHSRNVRKKMKPLLESIFLDIKTFTQEFFYEKCSVILKSLKEKVGSLQEQPKSLSKFAEYTKMLQAKLQFDVEIKNEIAAIESLQNVMINAEIKMNSQNSVVMDDLKNIQDIYSKTSNDANKFRSETMQNHIKSLGIRISSVSQRCSDLVERLQGPDYENAASFSKPDQILAMITDEEKELEKLKVASETYSEYQEIFNLDAYEWKTLKIAFDALLMRKKIWQACSKWKNTQNNALTIPFSELNCEELDKTILLLNKDAFTFEKKVRNAITKLLKEEISSFKTNIPLIIDLGNPNMQERHYQKIFDELNFKGDPNCFCLADLISKGLFKGNMADFVGEVSGTASGEANLEAAIVQVEKAWADTAFNVINYRDQRNVFILGGLDDVMQLLEDNMVELQTMQGSRFIFYMKERIETWSKKLSLLSETLDEWIQCQKKWMYLETIFAADDIKKQLPSEASKFAKVDKFFRSTMRRTYKNPICIEAVSQGRKMFTSLVESNQELDNIQRGLEMYLETKRAAFPRFYFLSNDELLEILSQTRDPQAVQPHLGKCFDAIAKLKFGENDETERRKMYGMISNGKGEYVEFVEVEEAVGEVEYWMGKIEKQMKSTLYIKTCEALENYPVKDPIHRQEWLFAYPAMVILIIDQIYWAREAETTFKKVAAGENGALESFYSNYVIKQIEYMVRLVRGDLTKLQRAMLGALLTIDVHGREVVKKLVERNVSSVVDFEWNRQLRYYWDTEEDKAQIRQTNTEFDYNYEYLGNGMRLVITPLTDIIYMTLTGAVHLKFGGAPAGPAGTGKTETVKDLAKALAVNCVVFNCSDGLDFKIMGRFFSGLIQSGAWACFDEFNRIDIEVLSVIAQQILTIQQAIINEVDEFEFEGNIIPRGPAFGVFITMNPGYAGRTELPDNLKALFRPVACMVPDYRMIAEIILFSFGFDGAFELSNKMSNLYKLSSEQLSKQDHYDFGMRAVKSVLVCAGQLKRKEPDQPEDILLIRAMRDSNVPKFLEVDLPLFGGIISDLFPGKNIPLVDYGKLQLAIEQQLRDDNKQVVPSLVTKIIQVHETQLVRHGMMIVGETGSGKSVNFQTLAKSIMALKMAGEVDKDGFYQKVKLFVLNPKSITAGELYGEFNDLSGEWKDGLVPKMVRQCVFNEGTSPEDRKWIVFDGPVDAVWIENMNTVLDDNKTLCLANSERIKLSTKMHMMFEVEDLKVASPATVSRCGMVFMEQVHIGIEALIDSWLKTQLSEKFQPQMKAIHKLLHDYTSNAIGFFQEYCKEKISTSQINLATSLISLCEALLVRFEEKILIHKEQSDRISRYIFCFALVWSIGGNCDDSSRTKFNEYAKEHIFMKLFDANEIPEDIYEICIDFDGIRYQNWSEIQEDFNYNPSEPYFNIIVPTVDTTRYRYVLQSLLENKKHTLFVGETGVGKSIIIQGLLNHHRELDNYMSCTANYSAQTKPSNLVILLEDKLEKKRKNLYGPSAGKSMLMFIDDLNMPALEEYGAQPPNELLRQVIDQGGYYDADKLFFKNVEGITFACACAPPGGGRNNMSQRIVRPMNTIWLSQLSKESMSEIFSKIFEGFIDTNFSELKHIADPIVKASVDIYERVSLDLLPTPMKSHYTFNLRDLSKVFQGILQIDTQSMTVDKMAFIRLWIHEASRIFRDRLINFDDKFWFDKLCQEQIMKKLDVEIAVDDIQKFMFGNFKDREEQKYSEIQEPEKNAMIMNEYLEEYNVTFPSQMPLVFFKDAITHIARITRVLGLPRGNSLLVGVGGSGRKSLTRLACFISNFECFSVVITRGYGINEWREDLKDLLLKAGADNKSITFLFSDAEIISESCLEDINNILNSGEVPNMFEPSELEGIVGKVRPLCKQAGIVDTRDNVLDYYNTLVRQNLHVVLAFSPAGSSFRNRCRMFPSLVNCCSIDWFNAWPEDALFTVAHHFLGSTSKLGIEKYVEPLCKICVKIHRTVEEQTIEFHKKLGRRNYTTPTSYLELIKLYIDMLRGQSDTIKMKIARYRMGLDKINSAESVVGKLKKELTALAPTLIQAEKDVGEFMVKVKEDQAVADVAKEKAGKDEAAAQEVASEVQVIKDDCQKDLDEALPAYYKAIKALDALDKKAIQEVKSFTTPPPLVATVLEAVCIMMDKPPTWKEGKKLLGQMDFLDQLKNYDKDAIKAKHIKKLKKYIMNPDFAAENVKKVSSAACCLCMWCHAMWVYYKVAKEIEPKKAKLATAEKKLEATLADLADKRKNLAEIVAKLAELKRQYNESIAKKDSLQRQKQQTSDRLARAKQLTGGLAEEKIRWDEVATQLENNDFVNLVGNMAVSCGCVAYLGPFTSEFRSLMMLGWIEECKQLSIPVTDNFSFVSGLGDPIVVRHWNICGLPADNFSIENGLISEYGRRWPLMIDPQGQANIWIRNTYRDKNLQVCKLSDKAFLRTLENGIRYGSPCLLENIEEELDPGLEPILLKQIVKKGGQMVLKLGDTDVPYSDEFLFFLTTKLPNPHYMPEICIKVTIINFTVTQRGLEDQLLVDVCRNERPDLEQKKDELTVNISNDKNQLKEIEDNILEMLSNSKGNILDDVELIASLGKSKIASTNINARMKEAEKVAKEINVAREGYRVIACRGSIIYFVVASLALIDPMYQYSLQFFKQLYNKQIKESEAAEKLEDRLAILLKDLTWCMYSQICQGLFEKDKLLYSFTIACRLLMNKGTITQEEWQSFLVGPPKCSNDDKACPEKLPWMTGKLWLDIVRLEFLDGFDGISDSIIKNKNFWSAFMESKTPHEIQLEEPWNKLSPFQKLLLLRVMRGEKLVEAIVLFVFQQLGERFTVSPPFDLEKAFQSSTHKTPLIFILSAGADVFDALNALAREKDKAGPSLKIVSLGQGQGPIAERLMEEGRSAGHWVCLQNCHLSITWMPTLQQILEETSATEFNDEYRLWLTSMPTPKFPVPILQNGVKITNEPPKGLKANLGRVFIDMAATDYYEDSTKPREWKKLLFATAFYNAIILERKKFGPIGWNIPYGWMNSDLKTANMMVKNYIEEQENVPWETLNTMVGDICYGGRVTDHWDERTNSTILKKYYVAELLEDEYKFDNSGNYYAPPESSIDEVHKFIKNLPMTDDPETFGLHPNANIEFQSKETKTLLDTLICMEGGAGGAGDDQGGIEDMVTQMAIEFEAKLPSQSPTFRRKDAHTLTFAQSKLGGVISLGVFFSQEMIRFNDLVEVIKKTLGELRKAIKGLIVMSDSLEDMFNCFVFQKIPKTWSKVAFPSLKPLAAWMADCCARLDFMNKWLLEGPPKCFWLPAFYFPQGFMTAVLQTHSRKTMIAIDTLGFRTQMTSESAETLKSEPENGACVFGLYMQGAGFDKETMRMRESEPRSLFDELPVIHLDPIVQNDKAKLVDLTCVYTCPLYKTSIRAGTLSTTGHSTNFVVALDIPTEKNKSDHWIRRGVALLCLLDF